MNNASSGIPASATGGAVPHVAGIRFFVILLFVAAAALYLTRLGATPLRVNAEIRTYEITQNMLGRHDYIVPIFRGETRYNKPPLYYWTVIGLSRLVGHFDLFIHRLPSAGCALLVLAMGIVWGKLLGRPREVLAGLALLSVTYLYVVQARRGSFEMMLTLLANASLLSFYLSAVRRQAHWAVLGAVLCGLGFLTKGTPVLLYVPLVLAIWLWGQGKLSRIWRGELVVVVAIAAVIGLAWHLYILAFRPDSRQDIISEALLPLGIKATQHTTAEHREPFYFYLLAVWRDAFPLSLFLPLVIRYLVKERLGAPDSPVRLLALTVAVPLLVFSIIPMKQMHYLLPALLPLAILTGLSFADLLQETSERAERWFRWPALLLAAIVACGGIAVGFGTRLVADASLLTACVAALVTVACGVLGFVAARHHAYGKSIVASVAGLWLILGAYFVLVRPIEDGFGSGALLRQPGFDRTTWETKFQRYPLLRKLLDYDRGLRVVERATKKGQVGGGEAERPYFDKSAGEE